KHPLIKRCISDFCPKESKAYSFPVSYGNFTSGDGGVPRGGSRAAALRMKARFEELGGTYRGSSPVKKIEVADGQAVGVTLENGEYIDADYIVPACDADFTFSQLLDPSYMPEKIREFFDNPHIYPIYGMFQAAWAVDDPRDLVRHETNLDVPELQVEPWLNDRITLKTYAYEPSFAPEGKQILQVLWGMDQSSWKFWKNLCGNKEAYRAKKAQLAALVQGKIEAVWPEYRGKLKLLDSWTPCTYKRYCNAHNGYNQSCVFTKGVNMRTSYPSPYIRGLKNLVLAGQWIVPPGGIPGACTTGKFAAYRVDYLEHKAWKIVKKVFWKFALPAAVVFTLIKVIG
ncbi:MAG: FAD-dependent oxidoreductase, partial [Spirochaetia bacterium]|nr:FAD-dependent oxidoreductase [Spirochaetia bacterium]